MHENVEGILLDSTGPIASITFNRPEKANYIDNNWIVPMRRFFDTVAGNPEVRCVVIKSTGKHFMAGGDLNYHDECIAMAHDQRIGNGMRLFDEWSGMLESLLSFRKPIIASVQGGAIGASFGLVCACDLVIASQNAFFVVAHVLHGGAIDGLITYFLPRQIGVKKTLSLAMLGERLSAAEAERLGLVTKVVPDDELKAETEKLVSRIANGPTVAYGMIKDLVWGSLDRGRKEQGLLENYLVAKSSITEDWEEGSDAVFRKREAKFRGR